ncbi:MAG: thioredoxin-disulfide reductase [Lachnospiraceae bacterium]|nr:thioredoxin-disulfide reductase [Lachnospiraceae bacterium]
MTDIIIVGAGPAGLTAAIYALRAGRTVLLLEAKAYGGQIVNTPDIENYPGLKHVSGYEYATTLYEQATGFGAEIKNETVISVEDKGDTKEVKTDAASYSAKAVIIATGAKNRHMGIDREEELTGRGVSYCATCDGAFFRGKDVAVCGGGNTALSDALFLSNYCRTVYLIHRRDEFRGSAADTEKVKSKENVKLVLNSTVEALKGEKTLSAVTVKNKITGELTDLEVNGIFVAIGQEPDNEAFKNVVDLDEKGYIISPESCETKTPGIYIAGDCRVKDVRQLTTAVSDGAVAALAACSALD